MRFANQWAGPKGKLDADLLEGRAATYVNSPIASCANLTSSVLYRIVGLARHLTLYSSLGVAPKLWGLLHL